MYTRTDGEKAEVAAKRADALAKYTSSGLDMHMTFEAFLEHVCEYEKDVVDMIIKSGADIVDDIVDEERVEE